MMALLLRAGLNSLRKIQISSTSKKNTNGLNIISTSEEEGARKRWLLFLFFCHSFNQMVGVTSILFG